MFSVIVPIAGYLSYKLRCYTGISSPVISRNNTREKYDFFSRLWCCCWHVTRLPHHSVRLMNERQSFNHSIQGRLSVFFFGLWELKNWKFRTAYSRWCSNLLRKGRKLKYEKKTESYVCSGFGNGISWGWKRKSTTGRFATGQFGRLPKRFLMSVRNNSINENFVHWKLGPLSAFVVIQRMFFILSAPTYFTIYIRGLPILLFPCVEKVFFSCHQRAIVFTW